jgi:hypothetical protein
VQGLWHEGRAARAGLLGEAMIVVYVVVLGLLTIYIIGAIGRAVLALWYWITER